MSRSVAARAICALFALHVLVAAATEPLGEPPPIDTNAWLDYVDNYRYVEPGFKPCGYAGEPRKAFRQQLKAMAEVLQHTPNVLDPGLVGAMQGDWSPCDAARFGDPRAAPAGSPMRGEVSFWPWTEADIVRAPGKRPRSNGETGPLHIVINGFPGPDLTPVAGEEAKFGLLPRFNF